MEASRRSAGAETSAAASDEPIVLPYPQLFPYSASGPSTSTARGGRSVAVARFHDAAELIRRSASPAVRAIPIPQQLGRGDGKVSRNKSGLLSRDCRKRLQRLIPAASTSQLGPQAETLRGAAAGTLRARTTLQGLDGRTRETSSCRRERARGGVQMRKTTEANGPIEFLA